MNYSTLKEISLQFCFGSTFGPYIEVKKTLQTKAKLIPQRNRIIGVLTVTLKKVFLTKMYILYKRKKRKNKSPVAAQNSQTFCLSKGFGPYVAVRKLMEKRNLQHNQTMVF
jgi:hypothetical protein